LDDLLTALALILVIEGALYGLFPDTMRRAMSAAMEMPPQTLRTVGMVAAVAGLGFLWLLRA
jgi:uncharacterized protein YjeT (DUF2065 family)